MKDLLIKLSVYIEMLKDENGQDLIEYALLAALIALAATVTIKGIGTDINTAFGAIGNNLTTNV